MQPAQVPLGTAMETVGFPVPSLDAPVSCSSPLADTPFCSSLWSLETFMQGPLSHLSPMEGSDLLEMFKVLE